MLAALELVEKRIGLVCRKVSRTAIVDAALRPVFGHPSTCSCEYGTPVWSFPDILDVAHSIKKPRQRR